jgi:hypothetical protein
MAKISAHGETLGTLEFIATAKRYMSDGVILKNSGQGWKLHGKVKPGIDPATAFANAKTRLEAALKEHAPQAAYRALLHDMAGMNKRWSLHLAVTMMPQDPDGVWSTACDSYGTENVEADLDDIVKLCAAYVAAFPASNPPPKED